MIHFIYFQVVMSKLVEEILPESTK